MQDVARLLLEVVHQLTESDAIAAFREGSAYETPADQRDLERPLSPLPARLGVRWREKSDEPPGSAEGLLVTHVDNHSPAAIAGLQVGDRIVRFNGEAVRDSPQFRLSVLHARSPVPIEVVRGSQGTRSLPLDLAGRPSRVGVSWRDDAAEPGTVLLTRVVPGSPGALAGLQPRDRIYSVAGRSFANSRELLELLSGTPGPIEVLVERQGRLEWVSMDVPPPQR
jgi:S1-C subfamily serine protease